MTRWFVDPKDLAVGHSKWPTSEELWNAMILDYQLHNGFFKRHPFKRIMHWHRARRNMIHNIDWECLEIGVQTIIK